MIATTVHADRSPRPRTWFNAMRAASGGAYWNQADEIDCQGTLRQGKLSGPRHIHVDLDSGRYAIQTNVGMQHGTVGFDGAHAWMRDEKGLVLMLDGPQSRREAATRSYIARNGWFADAVADPAVMHYLGTTRKHGHVLQRIKVHPAGGVAFQAWINADTHLLASIHRPDGSGHTITTRYADYRTVDGVRLPFVRHIGNGDKQYDSTLHIHQCQVLPKAVDAHFTLPNSTIKDAHIIGGKTLAKVPFQSYAGLILVPVSVHGAAPMPFILDSGGLNLLTPEAARKLGLDGRGNQPVSGIGSALQSLQVADVDHYRLGPVQLDKQRFLITPLPLLVTDRGDQPPVAGLIGYELLRRFTTRIDYANHMLTFSPAGGLRNANESNVVPLTFDSRTPQVRARVDGTEGVFTLDTGATNSLTLYAPFAATHDIALTGRTGDSHASGVGGSIRVRYGQVKHFAIGPFSLPRPTTTLSMAKTGDFASSVLGGNIGQGILSRFTLTLDYASRRMRLTPNARFDEPFVDNKPSLGLALNRVAHDRFRVLAVKKASPADMAGLKRGDTVVALDGVAASDIGLNELKSHLSDSANRGLDVTVLRDGQRKTIHVSPAHAH